MKDATDKYATSASLIERVKLNSEDAWRELATLYQPLLEYWIGGYSARKCPIQSCDAQDIIQEVWIGVRRNFQSFTLVSGRRSFRPWIRTILYRRIADYVRKKRGGKERGEAIPATDLVADLSEIVEQNDELIEVDDEKEREILLTSALKDISEKTKIDERHLRIFAHRYFSDRSNAEISEEFDDTKGNVSVIKSRVKKILNEVYGCFLD